MKSRWVVGTYRGVPSTSAHAAPAWPEFLAEIQWAHNTAKSHRLNGLSPFAHIFGREPAWPEDIRDGPPWVDMGPPLKSASATWLKELKDTVYGTSDSRERASFIMGL